MRSRIAPILVFLVTFLMVGPRAAGTEVDEAIAWLHSAAKPVLRASERSMYDGTAAFIPQSGGGYGAFWPRDYAYMLEGRIDVFTDQELIDAYNTFLDAQYVGGGSWHGACVDHVDFDGTPDYTPGYNDMGENPVADGSQFMVEVAWHTYQRTGNAAIISTTNMNKLEDAMDAVPRSGSGLVYIDPVPDWDRCPYGFTDGVLKQGEVLFSSLLYVQAARQMADLYEAKGNPTAQAAWTAESNAVATSIRNTFWNASEGIFHAATIQCNQADIWGSAFAVYLDVATTSQSTAVANYFNNNYSGLVERGQLRHTAPGEYWEACVSPQDFMQNGAYWGTPVGWFVYTLDRAGYSALADQTIVDMVDDFKDRGIFECVIGSDMRIVNYCSSVALPLDAILKIRTLVPLPEPELTLVEEGGSYGPDNLALASAGAVAFAVDELGYGGTHTITHLNDGVYGNSNSWIGDEPSPTLDEGFVGIKLDGVYQVNSIAFGRDNGVPTEHEDRWHGTYVLQYTTVTSPNVYTPDEDWIEIGTLSYPGGIGEDFSEPWLRHRYTFDPVVATGLRLIVPVVYSQSNSGATCIDEFEVYGSPIPGDTNLDGNVDQDDLETLATYWGQTGADWSMGDFDGDGVVGPEDAAILAANWGFSLDGGEAAAVPEPGTTVLLLGAVAVLLALRRGGDPLLRASSD